ncbi:GAF domain-containing protein [bacterium]|nr:GAF domain-containing protein [bacterium]
MPDNTSFSDRAGSDAQRLFELLKITRLLSTEKSIDVLLALILQKSRELTSADAGSLYVLEADQDGDNKLHFRLSQNDSVPMPEADFFLELSHDSIAGSVALTGQPVMIKDAYRMPVGLNFKHSTELDRTIGYETHSILTAPMINHRGEILGVIQLINKKRDYSVRLVTGNDYTREVIAFDESDNDLLISLASQAAIALENVHLYDELRDMFDGIVSASVHAIEQRDPTTSGHSRRVSMLSVELARHLNQVDTGPYAQVQFSPTEIEELRIAALLHDFGKIGVKETVLTKASKLEPLNLELIETRLDKILYYEESKYLNQVISAFQQGDSPADIQKLRHTFEQLKSSLQQYKEIIRKANEPTILPEGDFEIIDQIALLDFFDEQGRSISILSDRELECLKIRRGTLTPEEIDEIQSHARKTHEFLKLIPWGTRFKDLPLIAGTHHEKLNGTGYPYALKEAEIPIQSKIMAVADIFDALTASDRPYKKAVPVNRALDILGYEAKDNHLDKELVSIFVDHEIYKVVFQEQGE